MQISNETGQYNQIVPIIDTLAISKKLQASGMTQKQAETQAEVLGDIITHNFSTKTDVENIRKDIEILRKDTKTDVENIRKDIEALRKDTKTDVENIRKDIEALRKDTKTDIENLRKDIIIEISNIKFEIMKWIIPLMTGQLLATAGLFKLLK